MTENELRRYFDMFTDCWKFFRRNVGRMDDPGFWQQVADDNCETWAKHNHDPLMKTLLAATTKEIERIYDGRNVK